MPRRFWPILNTLLFTIFVPGTVAILIPRWLMGGLAKPPRGALTWIGGVTFLIGAAIYFAAPGNSPYEGWARRHQSPPQNS